jgi:hypothetical protein
MGVRNPQRDELRRLELKSLDSRFLGEIQQGLNCSPFEAEAVLQVVRDVYLSYLELEDAPGPPGKMAIVVVDADEPSGKPMAECAKRTVRLTVHRGAEDDQLLQQKGPGGFRLKRIPEVCQEALSQGGLLTREDLAYRIFFVTPRTITRDLHVLRTSDPPVPVPLRSMMQDIGPVLTHRVEIVRLALEGKTTTEICRIMRHSPEAVANYVGTFVRCAQLVDKKLQIGQIAFLLRRGRALIKQYLELLDQCKQDNNYAYHLGEMLGVGRAELKKTTRKGARR